MTVISNTSPLRYLILIDQFELLPQLFDRVLQQSATLGLIELTVVIERLRETNFWISSSLLQSLLEQDLSNP